MNTTDNLMADNYRSHGCNNYKLSAPNRLTDITAASQVKPTALPAIDWSIIGQAAPVKIPIGYRQATDPLPYADWVVITWTSAEWQAIDHVFLNSTANSNEDDYEWKKDWHQYSRNTGNFHADPKSGLLWGMFQMVTITDLSKRKWRVLLFKSNTHLAHAPWVDGLSAMMQCILTDTRADRVYTIGTAGGARLTQRLGDAVITNTATLELQRPQNSSDPGNGNAFRCASWYPGITLLDAVQDNLLLKLNTVVTRPVLDDLFSQLQSLHPTDPGIHTLHLDDLLNDALSPESLGKPAIQNLQDAPLLTTDFYYIATGNSAEAFAFLEMDDAIIAREANKLGVRFACIRNISDPVVPNITQSGTIISDTVRGDWSGLIYSHFGLYTSFNGALATWATIAGEGSTGYNPKRFVESPDKEDPIEVKLAFKVRSCGTCKFFWPDDKTEAPYGPYTAFDFDVNIPYQAEPVPDANTSEWVLGRTRPPAFPNPEVADGCRKAPVMTIGINPNLTEFLPGQNGAAWAYPNFSSDKNTNAWAKYAWYYRYRSVYQEKLTLNFVKQFILPDGQVIAPYNGRIVSATRVDANPSWEIQVRFDGAASDEKITIPGMSGDFPYMLFYDVFPPNNTFLKGDVIAGKLAVPQGIQVPIQQEQQGYYMQFVPVLKQLENYLKQQGHADAELHIGEDVSQLDMVACASPHWTQGFLGNQMDTIVHNCVSDNAWAIKQLVQTKPAILYIVSEASWNMFYNAFGKFVDPGMISEHPDDQSYTLLRETTQPGKPVFIRFNFDIDGTPYQSNIRLVITPHFSFNNNFLPQYRFSPHDFAAIADSTDFKAAVTYDNGFTILEADKDHPYYYREIQLQTATAEASRAQLKQQYPDLFNQMEPYYYDSHELMASVLKEMYDAGELTYDEKNNNLARTEGACRFCSNNYWQFPGECRYGKTKETSPPPGFLEKVADHIARYGKPEKPTTAEPEVKNAPALNKI